jgi:hypothetical protein
MHDEMDKLVYLRVLKFFQNLGESLSQGVLRENWSRTRCVVGEAVLDATSPDHAPQQLALHVHGVMWLQQTSGGVRFPIFGDAQPYVSGGVGQP